MGKMLVLLPEQVKEVCKREEEKRKKKEVKQIQKIQQRKRQFATFENTRVLESKFNKVELAKKQNLLSLWMKNIHHFQNSTNDPKGLMVRIN